MPMRSRLLTVSLTTILLLTAAPKKNTGTARGENQDIMLDATIYVDGEAVKEIVGNDLDGHYVVAMVTVIAHEGLPVARHDLTSIFAGISNSLNSRAKAAA